MTITRYPQSCLVIQNNGHTIVIDPGTDFLESHTVDDLAGVEAVLYTHQHGDHYDASIEHALRAKGAEIICNASTATLIEGDCHVVNDGDSFEVFGFSVVARELPHSLLPDGAEGPQNTGYVIDGVLFHPGDGKDIDDLLVDTLALPITGPDISMKDAFDFAKKLEAKTVIPIHYDKLGASPDVYKAFADRLQMPFETIVLADGESIEL